jgi:hypothetical protein
MFARVLEEVDAAIKEMDGDVHFFRGHSDASWQLSPSLARLTHKPNLPILEAVTYYDFVTRAGSLLSTDDTGWNIIFAMQHHGLPTRLLDWTTTFAVALYFAVQKGGKDAAVWVLDPFALNKVAWMSETLPAPTDVETNYVEAFVVSEKVFPANVLAISPIRLGPRVSSQRAAFTVHADLEKPLETLYPESVRKIVIPAAEMDEAKQFLRLAGISEYSLFPDLDGLARELLLEHYS